MIISPMGSPILQITGAINDKDFYGVLSNTGVTLTTICFILAVGLLIGQIFSDIELTEEMEKRCAISPSTRVFFLACVLGFFMTYYMVNNDLDNLEQVGVAIAISLLPPIICSGMVYLNKTIKNPKQRAMNSFMVSMYSICGILVGGGLHKILVAILALKK
jgi:hypothetical protein